MKKCQFCSKDLPDEAEICPYCKQPYIDPVVHEPWRNINWWLLVTGLIIVFVMLLLRN